MKYIKLSYQKIIIIVFSILMGNIHLDAERISLSFDSLFPSSWYEKALYSSMYVWGNLQDIQTMDTHQLHHEQHGILLDAMLGRMVFAQFCLEHMTQDESQVVFSDDVVYLKNIMNKIEQTVSSKDSDDRMACFKYIVGKIKKSLNGAVVCH